MSICAPAHGDVIKVGSLLARVLETPGHTLDHISYVFDSEKAVFAADTLFSIGCGRVFEGTYPDDVGFAVEAARAARRFQTLLRPRVYRRRTSSSR